MDQDNNKVVTNRVGKMNQTPEPVQEQAQEETQEEVQQQYNGLHSLETWEVPPSDPAKMGCADLAESPLLRPLTPHFTVSRTASPANTPSSVPSLPDSLPDLLPLPPLFLPPRPSDPVGARLSSRERLVMSSVLEKSLVNLGVVADLEVGDKLDRDPEGNFFIQKPGTRTTLWRTLMWKTRRQTMEHIKDLIGTTENSIRENAFELPMIRTALVNAVHGLRNLQSTYSDDAFIRRSIEVLLEKIRMRYNLSETQML